MANRAGAEILDSVSSAWLWGKQMDPPLDSQSLDCFLGLELYPNPPQLLCASPRLLADPSFLSPQEGTGWRSWKLGQEGECQAG